MMAAGCCWSRTCCRRCHPAGITKGAKAGDKEGQTSKGAEDVGVPASILSRCSSKSRRTLSIQWCLGLVVPDSRASSLQPLVK